MKKSVTASAFLAAFLLAASGGALAQASGIKRTVVTKQDVAAPGQEAVVAQCRFQWKLTTGYHVG